MDSEVREKRAMDKHVEEAMKNKTPEPTQTPYVAPENPLVCRTAPVSEPSDLRSLPLPDCSGRLRDGATMYETQKAMSDIRRCIQRHAWLYGKTSAARKWDAEIVCQFGNFEGAKP